MPVLHSLLSTLLSRDARSREDLRIGALGSGSDYSPFLQHLGIASLNMSYGGEDDGGLGGLRFKVF